MKKYLLAVFVMFFHLTISAQTPITISGDFKITPPDGSTKVTISGGEIKCDKFIISAKIKSIVLSGNLKITCKQLVFELGDLAAVTLSGVNYSLTIDLLQGTMSPAREVKVASPKTSYIVIKHQ